MKINTIILTVLIALASSCKKEPEAPTGDNKILIGNTKPDTVSYLFAKVSTQLNGTGGVIRSNSMAIAGVLNQILISVILSPHLAVLLIRESLRVICRD